MAFRESPCSVASQSHSSRHWRWRSAPASVHPHCTSTSSSKDFLPAAAVPIESAEAITITSTQTPTATAGNCACSFCSSGSSCNANANANTAPPRSSGFDSGKRASPALALASLRGLTLTPDFSFWAAWWAKYAAKLQEYLEAHPPYSEAYLHYVTASCTRVEAAQVAFMIVMLPASQVWVTWVPSENELVVIALQVWGTVPSAYGVTRMLRACSAPRTFRRSFEVCSSLIGSLGYLLLGIVSSSLFDVFPVPLGQVFYTAIWSAFIYPLTIVMFMEPGALQDPARRQAVLAAYALHWGIVALLCNGAPLSLAALAMLQDRGLAQLLTLLSPWVLRKVFEALCRVLFKKKHPELLPTTRLVAISFYEGYLSIVMMSTADFQWYVIPVAITCDLLENFMYLLMIRHTATLARNKEAETETSTKLKLKSKEVSVDTDAVRVAVSPSSLDITGVVSPSSRNVVGPSRSSESITSITSITSNTSNTSNRQRHETETETETGIEVQMRKQGLIGLVASVLVKEVMEVVIPLQTLAAMAGMYVLNPKWNVLCAGVGPGDFWHGIFVLLADVLLETIMLVLVMQTVRWTCGLNPWSLLVRVIHHDLHTMGTLVITGFMLNIGFQHTYHGSDLTLQFRWLREGAVWHGGMCWTFGEETPQQVCRQSWHRDSG